MKNHTLDPGNATAEDTENGMLQIRNTRDYTNLFRIYGGGGGSSSSSSIRVVVVIAEVVVIVVVVVAVAVVLGW